jgi:hypothetical protein
MKNLLILILFISVNLVLGQEKKKEDPEKKDKKTIAELTKSSKKIEGLFTIYQDTVSGDVKMSLSENQLHKDFIYFSQIADGVTEAGSFRGSYRGSTIINIKKYFNKIEIVAPNTNFYFDPENPLSKSERANTSDAILSSNKILVHDKEKALYLIDATGLFLSETLTRIKSPKRPGASPSAFSLGSFDKGKSKIESIKNYPENTNIKTEYVYKNPSVLNGGSEAIQDGRNVSIKVFHSFLSMPEAGYTIQYDDPRVGYFTTQVNDMTAEETTNYRDLVHRWRLIKKDAKLAISEPIKPITWWIENSTPLEWRETIKEGVLAWNEAFEKAGFKNAMEVKVQPDDAEWDAGDIRYNVLRWTSSPNPPFGGYGPSMTNPRTGEIIGADIMLEFVHFTNRVFYDKLFTSAAANMALENQEEFESKDAELFCSLGNLMHENILFGKTLAQVSGASASDLKQIIEEGMKSLIMHEVGHTLGLNHNMKASVIYTPDQLADAAFIEGKALTGSVMDYAGINLTLDKEKQGQYFDMAVGPYDIWAIQFGYTPFKNEGGKTQLLLRSTEPQLIFGNDADDMRSPGKGIDPRVMTGDLSGDQITYSIDRFKLVNAAMKEIKVKMTKKGETYEDLRRAYYTLNGQAARAGDVLSRFVGGVYVDRSMIGQEGGNVPYTPVNLRDQKRALSAIEKYVFAPNAFAAPGNIYNSLAKQRRGFDFFSGPEDPKIHDRILGYQTRVLSHLMHPNTLQRIMDSELYGNQYRLDVFMTDLNDAIFKEDIKGNVNTFRQNLQAVYVERLIEMVAGKSNSRFKIPAKSLALYNLNKIAKLTKNPKGDIASIAHKDHLNTLITNALKEIK